MAIVVARVRSLLRTVPRPEAALNTNYQLRSGHRAQRELFALDSTQLKKVGVAGIAVEIPEGLLGVLTDLETQALP